VSERSQSSRLERQECPGSRAYLPRRGTEAQAGEAIPIEFGGEFNLPTRAQCPCCLRVYAVSGPATYLTIRKHSRRRVRHDNA
jgi:hypothetical protein